MNKLEQSPFDWHLMVVTAFHVVVSNLLANFGISSAESTTFQVNFVRVVRAWQTACFGTGLMSVCAESVLSPVCLSAD